MKHHHRLNLDGYRVYPSDPELEITLALHELEVLGYQMEAIDAEAKWEHGRPWTPSYDLDLPLSVRQTISALNLRMGK